MKAGILELLRRKGDYVSGQELCKLNNVSRTAVWKAINSLKDEGYNIEAVRNKGYRLIEDANPKEGSGDIYSKSEIASRLDPSSCVSEVVFLDSVDSTNAECARRAEAGAESGLLVVTDVQTSGRGRRGRSWDSPGGLNVYFSLMIRPDIEPASAPQLTLVMALAVCRAMEKILTGDAYVTSGKRGIRERHPASPLIKWPNDIVINGKKICGILTEMSFEADFIRHIVLGVGINVRHREFPDEIKDTASCLDDEWDMKTPRSRLVAETMNEFGLLLEQFTEAGDLSFLRGAYHDRLVNAGRKVKVLDPRGEYEGIARGIDETGELLVETKDGKILPVNAGEVSVRGVYGYV